MSRFASRDLSFVSLPDDAMFKVTDNTQQCAGADGRTGCTCCTDNTNRAKPKASDEDLFALQEQLLVSAR